MNYLFITGQLNGGGAERVLLDILRNFDYGRHSVHLCQLVAGGMLAHEIPEQVVQIPLWNDYSMGFKLAWHASLKLGIHGLLRRRFRHRVQGQYDVAISFLEGAPLRLHALAQPRAKRHISWVHCDLFHFPYERSQFRSEKEELAAYNAMDTVVCVAQDTERAFKRRFPGCTASVRTIYNPVDIAKIRRMAEQKNIVNEKFTVICPGRISPPKKIDRVVRAAALIKPLAPDIRFLIMGQGELKEEILRLIDEFHVGDVVEIISFQSNPFPYIKAADLLLSTSVAEGFSLVACEAMALGTPVVSTKTAGPMEILEENRYGLLCGHDDQSIADAILSLYRSPDLRQSYGKAGKIRVQDFSVEKTMEAIDAL